MRELNDQEREIAKAAGLDDEQLKTVRAVDPRERPRLDPAVEGVLFKAPEAYADVAEKNKRMSEGKYPKHGFAYSPPPGKVWNPARDYPRNLPCLCGSGLKYKKCHLKGMADCVTPEEALSIAAKIKEVLG